MRGKNKRGSVLTATLPLIFIITIILLTQLKSEMIEQKVALYFYAKQRSFHAAELGLNEAELRIKKELPDSRHNTDKPKEKYHYTITELKQDSCKNRCFLIKSEGYFGSASTKLEINYLQKGETHSSACQERRQNSGRVKWHEMIR